jgi:hypothetical protein
VYFSLGGASVPGTNDLADVLPTLISVAAQAACQ